MLGYPAAHASASTHLACAVRAQNRLSLSTKLQALLKEGKEALFDRNKGTDKFKRQFTTWTECFVELQTMRSSTAYQTKHTHFAST